MHPTNDAGNSGALACKRPKGRFRTRYTFNIEISNTVTPEEPA